MNMRDRKFTTKHLMALMSIAMAAWLLITGILQPDGFVMSFASAGVVHSVLRAIMITALIIVLTSRPPRSPRVRLLLGSISAVLMAGGLSSIVHYQIGILDIVLYTQVAIILAIEAIEIQTAPVRFASKPSPAQ
jgi:hypothetical protein